MVYYLDLSLVLPSEKGSSSGIVTKTPLKKPQTAIGSSTPAPNSSLEPSLSQCVLGENLSRRDVV